MTKLYYYYYYDSEEEEENAFLRDFVAQETRFFQSLFSCEIIIIFAEEEDLDEEDEEEKDDSCGVKVQRKEGAF